MVIDLGKLKERISEQQNDPRAWAWRQLLQFERNECEQALNACTAVVKLLPSEQRKRVLNGVATMSVYISILCEQRQYYVEALYALCLLASPDDKFARKYPGGAAEMLAKLGPAEFTSVCAQQAAAVLSAKKEAGE